MTKKARIEIALLLPAVPDARDACVQRLGDLLSAHEGIETAYVDDSDGDELGQICIHYDPEQLSMGEVRDLAHRAGVELEQRFGHLLLNTEPMYAGQARMVESAAKQISGVTEATTSGAGVLRIEFDRQTTDEDTIKVAARKLGVQIIESTPEAFSAELVSRYLQIKQRDML